MLNNTADWSLYDAQWGALKPITYPLPGNHEYSADIDAYNEYWGDAAHAPLHYYSFDLGSWHVVALNGEVDTSIGSEQEQWFRADLAAHPAACTVVAHPRATLVELPRPPVRPGPAGAVGRRRRRPRRPVACWPQPPVRTVRGARRRRLALRRGHDAGDHRDGWSSAPPPRPRAARSARSFATTRRSEPGCSPSGTAHGAWSSSRSPVRRSPTVRQVTATSEEQLERLERTATGRGG